MTKDNWIKAFEDLHSKILLGIAINGDDKLSWVDAMKAMQNFISQVEKDAIEKTNKRWLKKLGIKDGHSYKVWRDGDSVYFADEDNFKVKSDLLEDKK